MFRTWRSGPGVPDYSQRVPARLHHERIARTDSTPDRWLAMTHGIYGAGSNWRGIARAINNRRPEWGIVLVDLRQHGRSERGEPPHTIAACAEDLGALITELGSVAALAGHSFGGKVVLATRARIELAQSWVLDASPSGQPGTLEQSDNAAASVLTLLERLPATWARRDDFVAAVMAAGHDAALAQWLATNIVAADGAFVLRLDVTALHALLTDYFAQDLWAELAEPRGELELVIADRASTLSPADLTRLQTAAPHVHVHHVDAGHWLHIEAPATIVDLFVAHLR